MSLTIDLHIGPHYIGQMTISRLDYLDLSDKAAIADRVCQYEVEVDRKAAGTVEHRYGDGKWVLLGKALALYNGSETTNEKGAIMAKGGKGGGAHAKPSGGKHAKPGRGGKDGMPSDTATGGKAPWGGKKDGGTTDGGGEGRGPKGDE